MNEPTALYRLFDEDGKLLYVGITKNPSVRFVHHKMEKSWWPNVVQKDITWFDSRTAAMRAEEEAIHQELPFWNVSKSLTRKQARRATRRTWVRPQAVDVAHGDSSRVLLAFATSRFRAEEARRNALREELASAIRAANADGVPQKDIAEVTEYTRQQVRRIVLTEPQDA